MKEPPIGTPPREASEQRLAEEQARRVPLTAPGEGDMTGADIDYWLSPGRVVPVSIEGTAWLVKHLRWQRAELERLQAALREARPYLVLREGLRGEDFSPVTDVLARVDAALSGKGET